MDHPSSSSPVNAEIQDRGIAPKTAFNSGTLFEVTLSSSLLFNGVVSMEDFPMFVDLSENPAVRVNDGFAKPRTILLTVCASIV